MSPAVIVLIIIGIVFIFVSYYFCKAKTKKSALKSGK